MVLTHIISYLLQRFFRKEILCAEALGMSMALRKVVSSGKPWSKVPKEGTCSHTQLRLFLGIPKDIWGKIL